MDVAIGKEQFLAEHNRLSPADLKTTFAMLTRFQQEKKPLLQDADWSFKLRMPLIMWLGSLPKEKLPYIRKSTTSKYRNYPETKY